MEILYLSHTDIRSDSRILKSMQAGINDGHHVSAIGISASEGTINASNDIAKNIITINLSSRQWIFLPKPLRHIINLIEMTFKMFSIASSKRAHLIHCNDTIVLPLAVLVKIFSKKIRLIYDAHELESNRNGLPLVLGYLTYACEKFLWPFIDGLIVVSPSIKNWYLNHFKFKPATVVLNSPIYYKNNVIKNSYLRDKFNIPSTHKIYLYIGIIAPGRGIDLLLNVFSTKDLNASIIFLGYGELTNEVINTGSKFNNIHYHKAVVHHEVVSIAASADYGFCLVENVSLSDYYSLPNKLFEYLFAGLPVVASNFPDINQLLKQCNAGLTTNLDQISILKVIRDLNNSLHTFNINIEILHGYGWEFQELKLSSFYKSILSN